MKVFLKKPEPAPEVVPVSVVNALLQRIAALEAKQAVAEPPKEINAELEEIASEIPGDLFAPINYETSLKFLNSIWGNISKHGIKIMADGRQWVIHCLTGVPMERKEAKAFKDSKNNIFWIGKDETLSLLDKPHQYVWQNPDHSSV